MLLNQLSFVVETFSDNIWTNRILQNTIHSFSLRYVNVHTINSLQANLKDTQIPIILPVFRGFMLKRLCLTPMSQSSDNSTLISVLRHLSFIFITQFQCSCLVSHREVCFTAVKNDTSNSPSFWLTINLSCKPCPSCDIFVDSQFCWVKVFRGTTNKTWTYSGNL